MWMVLAISLLLLLPSHIQGLPNGAPTTACSSLTPKHSGIAAQSQSSPYTVTAIQVGGKIRVTISSPIGEEFEGFVLQARSSREKKKAVDGKFSTNRLSKTIDCFKGTQNTLTQTNTSPKREIVTEWTPSGGVRDDVIFRATVAKTYAVFWTGIDSSPIRVVSESSGREVQRQQGSYNSVNMYDDCFVSKGCLGYPTGCIPQANCEVLLSYSNNARGIAFGISGAIESGNYIAMALSTDQIMGDDTVMECIRRDSNALLRESWNDGKSNTRTRELPRNAYSSSVANGLASCEWISNHLFDANGRSFDLANSTYYLLLAKGPTNNGRLGYHSGRLYTQEAVNFTAFEALAGGRVHDAIKIHGTFMVTAWVGFVSVAIILARHFKSSWENRTICGVKVWFALHRGLMIAGLVFVVVAFIVIFFHKDGWNYNTRNPHAILGCIATAFGLFQPIMAAFRPAPDHTNRPIFNWLHWIMGNAAQIISVVTIFFAVSLESSGLKESFYWVMAIYVIVLLIFHTLFQLHTWTSDKKKNGEMKMNEMNGRTSNTQSNIQDKNPSADVFRVLLLGIYGIFVVVILMALYALIGVA